MILIVFILRFLSKRGEYNKNHDGSNSSIVFNSGGGVLSSIDKKKKKKNVVGANAPFLNDQTVSSLDMFKSFFVCACGQVCRGHELAEPPSPFSVPASRGV